MRLLTRFSYPVKIKRARARVCLVSNNSQVYMSIYIQIVGARSPVRLAWRLASHWASRTGFSRRFGSASFLRCCYSHIYTRTQSTLSLSLFGCFLEKREPPLRAIKSRGCHVTCLCGYICVRRRETPLSIACIRACVVVVVFFFSIPLLWSFVCIYICILMNEYVEREEVVVPFGRGIGCEMCRSRNRLGMVGLI